MSAINASEPRSFTPAVASVAGIALVLILGGSPTVAAPWRVAILADSQMQTAGLADLLLARLGEDLTSGTMPPSIVLVERQQIRLVLDELSLADLFDSSSGRIVGDAAGLQRRRRLQAGRLLKADALVLLSSVQGEKEPAVRLVVSDCHQGIRLGSDTFAASGAEGGSWTPPDELVLALADAVRSIAEKYSDGIGRVIGLSPVASKNLTRKHDHLQAGYTRILQRALARQENLAIIEIEEARSIGRELELTGTTLADRSPMALVEGEYRMSDGDTDSDAAGRSDSVTVSFRFAVTIGSRRHVVTREDVPLDAAASCLIAVLSPEILSLAKGQAGRGGGDSPQQNAFPAEQEFRWLASQADKFSRLGAWQESTALREAALLLRPDDVAQRVAVMREYHLLKNSGGGFPGYRDWGSNPEAVKKGLQWRVRYYLAILPHLEYVLRNRLLAGIDCVEWCNGVQAWKLRCFPQSGSRFIDDSYYRYACSALAPAEEAEDRFFDQVYPDIRYICGNSTRYAQVLIGSIVQRADRQYVTRHELDRLAQAMIRVVPETTVEDGPQHLAGFWQDSQHENAEPTHSELSPPAASGQDWLSFFDRLVRSEDPLVHLAGRYYQIAYRLDSMKLPAKGPVDSEDQATQLSLLLKESRQLRDALAGPPINRASSKLEAELDETIKKLELALGLSQEIARPVAGVHGEHPIRTFPTSDAAIECRPIELRIKQRSGSLVPLSEYQWKYGPESYRVGRGRFRRQLKYWLQCDAGLDVLWNTARVLFVREPGLAEEILVDDESFVSDVQWDGRYVWIATRRSGVIVLDAAGKPVARFTEPGGLPPAELGLLLSPLGPAKVCAVGAFGQPGRTWLAILDFREALQPGKPGPAASEQVNVFHRATAIKPLQPHYRLWPNPEFAFIPETIERVDGEGHCWLQLARGSSQGFLLIDPQSLEVAVSERSYPASGSQNLDPDTGLRLTAAPRAVTFRYADAGHAPDRNDDVESCVYPLDIAGQIIPLGDWLYLPGASSLRVHRTTLALESVASPSEVFKESDYLIGPSAHFGQVMTCHTNDLWQVVIHEHAGEEPARKSPDPDNGRRAR